ncbi:transcriptional regulator [Methylorubrum sp. SB2]|uniref:transcriptional regulator n=1 Tax=Methylorubrum subtropicum TaxID=3138812 RepID=UPI00313EB942
MSHDLPPPIISPEQCRAARAVLGMTVAGLYEASGVALGSVVKFEKGGEVRATVADRLRAAFEARGVTFAPDGLGLTWQPLAS